MSPTLAYIHADLRAIAVELDTLTPDPKNARKHSQANLDAIRASFERWGCRKPIVVQRCEDGALVVRAGNGRMAVARSLGWTHLPAIVVDEGDQEAVAFALADNRTAELAEWDQGVLDELAGTVDLDWSAFAWGDLGALGEPVGAVDPGDPGEPRITRDQDDTPPEPPAEPVTQLGDLWILGDHRLVCGDSFDPEARSLLTEERLADLALMDPPFAIYGSSTGIGADIADDKMIRPFFAQLGQTIVQSVREFAHVYVCCDWRSWATVWDGMKAAKLSPKNCLVWDKGDGGMGSMYGNCHELVGFFARLPPARTMTSSNKTGQRLVYGQPNVLRYSRVTGEDRQHNAAKPVDMLAQLVENSSDPGDLVLDLFNGSGSVIMACERTGRHARAMELEPRYCDVTVARWERATGRQAVRVRPGG